MYYYEGFAPYVSVGERTATNEAKLTKYLVKHPDARPVQGVGTKLAATWWGKAWNKNLESYADFANRMGRGKTYLRTGAVYDLQILAGQITAVVQGSARAPYQVQITIDPLNKAKWQAIVDQCQGQIESLQQLLMGDFPKDLGEHLLRKGDGLFPNPQEIHLHCSCPDSAGLCKHLAAALYGVGCRLDHEPQLFFALRQVAVDDLITQALGANVEALLAGANKPSARILPEDNLADLFGL